MSALGPVLALITQLSSCYAPGKLPPAGHARAREKAGEDCCPPFFGELVVPHLPQLLKLDPFPPLAGPLAHSPPKPLRSRTFLHLTPLERDGLHLADDIPDVRS